MTEGPYAAALASLRRITAALATAAPDELASLIALQAEALSVLEGQRRRLSTEALAARVATLERQLADREPGERRDVICERLGISRRYFYRLRALSAQNCALQGAEIEA
ncbi:MAG: hypothetical protein IRZ28_01495 [Steroidobacteraceae bacterium]|nr:hypothetical protein [Steroidobacteraceae bacterium]